MKPSRPYIVKALYDWLIDSELTPYLVVNAAEDNVIVPLEFVEDDQIVLNISPSAVRNIFIDDEAVSFNARFSGKPMDVYVPMLAVMAIYARENGEGMGFGAEPGVQCYLQQAPEVVEDQNGAESSADNVSKERDGKKRPALKIVK